MSCPDWTALTAHRHEGSPEPEGWSEALAHFDGGCTLCRKAALKADPTLVFRRLAQVPASTMSEAQERAEVESVRQAVAAMRAASRLESVEKRKRGRAGWKRWSAAAALAMLVVTVPSDNARQPADQAAIFQAGQAGVADASQAAEMPLEGGVNLPGARVYHLSQDDLAVVMVVDESFDI